MKSSQTLIVATIVAIMGVNLTKAQTYKQAPKSSEIVIGTVSYVKSCGTTYELYNYDSGCRCWLYDKIKDSRTYLSEDQLFTGLYNNAKDKYGMDYPRFYLRNFKSELEKSYKGDRGESMRNHNIYTYVATATVVVPNPQKLALDNLSKCLDKAMQNLREGSKIAIDQMNVQNGTDREDFKDQVVDMLLEKGFKVVAKEYLQKLYEEQLNQQSGIYNDRTTVQENNFSAVGYFINVKVTESSVRVQVINVSTGEYEGNTTINF